MKGTIYNLISVALLVFSGLVIINGCSKKVGNALAVALFIVAVFGMILAII